MLITNDVIADVDKVAWIYYINKDHAANWNANRRGDELRLLTGWMWVHKRNTNQFNRCLKSKTAAYIDAWYNLVEKRDLPKVPAPIRVVVRNERKSA